MKPKTMSPSKNSKATKKKKLTLTRETKDQTLTEQDAALFNTTLIVPDSIKKPEATK